MFALNLFVISNYNLYHCFLLKMVYVLRVTPTNLWHPSRTSRILFVMPFGSIFFPLSAVFLCLTCSSDATNFTAFFDSNTNYEVVLSTHSSVKVLCSETSSFHNTELDSSPAHEGDNDLFFPVLTDLEQLIGYPARVPDRCDQTSDNLLVTSKQIFLAIATRLCID